MALSLCLTTFILALAVGLPASAAGWICHWNDCDSRNSSSRTGNPSLGSKVRLNPAAVPVEKGWGAEVIAYDGEYDFALIRGLGRVGAAISPANSEETFFGPPGFELPQDYLVRRVKEEKYKSSKLALATALQVYSNKRTGLKRFDISLGVMGKYNRVTNHVTPGGGLNGVLGPFTYGYSRYSDESLYDRNLIRYNVETYSVGIFMTSFIFDYSKLRLLDEQAATVDMLTATLLINRFILAATVRTEMSDRPAFNSMMRMLEEKRKKQEEFFGAQFRVTPEFMISGYYNYYLMQDVSIGAALFF